MHSKRTVGVRAGLPTMVIASTKWVPAKLPDPQLSICPAPASLSQVPLGRWLLENLICLQAVFCPLLA